MSAVMAPSCAPTRASSGAPGTSSPQKHLKTTAPEAVNLAVVVEQGVADPTRSADLMRAEVPFLSIVLR